jgi:hypothetical protein
LFCLSRCIENVFKHTKGFKLLKPLFDCGENTRTPHGIARVWPKPGKIPGDEKRQPEQVPITDIHRRVFISFSDQSALRTAIGPLAEAQAQHDQETERTSKYQLVETYLPLVITLAARHRPNLRCLASLDLVQEGNIGLLRAVNSYDYAHPGKSFTAYVHVVIRHALSDALLLDDGITVSPGVFYKQRAVLDDCI